MDERIFMNNIIITIGKNEFSRIVHEGETVICITHTTSGKKAITDNRADILERIINESKERRKSLVPKRSKQALEFPKSPKGISSSSLATIVYSQWHNIPLNDLRNHHIRHIRIDREIEDCRASNLYSTAIPVIESQSFKVEFSQSNKYCNVLLKASGRVVCFENNIELFNLLANPSLITPFMNKRRPQAKIKGLCDRQSRCEPYLSVLAYACYYQGLTADNHLQEIPKLLQYNKDNHLQVEHLNGDVFDNRRYNLALVKGSLNSSKKDVMKYLRAPYICNVVIGVDSKFRMMLGRAERAEDLLNGRLIILDTFADVVEVLNTYKKVYPTLFKQPSESEHYVFREPVVSETLATMSAEYFTPYKKWLAEAEHLTRKG